MADLRGTFGPDGRFEESDTGVVFCFPCSSGEPDRHSRVTGAEEEARCSTADGEDGFASGKRSRS